MKIPRKGPIESDEEIDGWIFKQIDRQIEYTIYNIHSNKPNLVINLCGEFKDNNFKMKFKAFSGTNIKFSIFKPKELFSCLGWKLL